MQSEVRVRFLAPGELDFGTGHLSPASILEEVNHELCLLLVQSSDRTPSKLGSEGRHALLHFPFQGPSMRGTEKKFPLSIGVKEGEGRNLTVSVKTEGRRLRVTDGWQTETESIS